MNSNEYQCIKCNHVNNRYTSENALYISCQNCGFFFNFKNNQLVNLSYKNSPIEILIPIGATVVFDSVIWTVVAVVHKYDCNSIENWTEYTLFNKENNFCYLSVQNGHWTFIKQINKELVIRKKNNQIAYRNSTWNLFSFIKKVKVDYASGEFDTISVIENKTINIKEYINPPFVLINEFSNSTNDWFEGKYIYSSIIKQKFNLNYLPKKIGVGALEPSFFRSTKEIIYTFLFFAFLFTTACVYFESIKSSQIKLNSNFKIIPDSLVTCKPIKSAEFIVDELQNMEILLESNLNNNWLEADFTLVNETTDEEFYFSEGVEYYSGTDWAEGSITSSIILSSIPKGRYHINIFPYVGNILNYNLNLQVKTNVSQLSNFWLYLAIVSIFFIVTLDIRGNKEEKRWSNSNYKYYN